LDKKNMKKLLFFLLFPYLVTAQSLDWQVQDVDFSTGDTVVAEFRTYGFDTITAYQFAMLFDTAALKFVSVTFPAGNPMGLTTGHFSWHGKPGYNTKPRELRHLRSIPFGQTYADGTHGFSYVFVAKQSGTLSSKMSLSMCCLSPPLGPVSYRWILTAQPLTVAYIVPSTSVASTWPTLADQVRIYPNPTTDALTIECDAPVTVEIFSYTGTRTHRSEITKDDFLQLTPGANIVRITDGKTVVLRTVFRL
jgi:hypothetical protein